MESFQILFSIAAVIFALYYFFTSTFDFWKARGVPGPQPIPGFGNIKDLILGRESLDSYLIKLYKNYKDELLIGIFNKRTPVLLVKEPDLIRDILIKDFSLFADRGYTTHEKTEPLSQHLLFLEPKRWRPLRNNLTPVFTSRKLKKMFFLISECADHLVQYMEKIASKNEPVECRELTAKYTTDVIGSCIFGLEMNAMSNEDSEFRRIGRNIFHPPWTHVLRSKIKSFSPRLYDILGYIVPDSEVTKFFIRLVMDTINYRERNNIVRHNFIDILRELKEQSDKVGDIDFTDSLITSQAFIFFAAGFETSSTTMTNMLYELALNPKIQDKLRKEINQSYAKYSGDLTYENVKKMEYFDKVFKVGKESFVFSTLDDENGEKLDEMFGVKPSFLQVQPSRCMLPPKFVFYAQKIRDFPVYEDDVWMISYPRTGSHWAQEMMWCIGHDFNYETARTLIIMRSPLLEGSALMVNGHYDDWFKKLGDTIENTMKMPRPRYIKSHLPWDLLPRQLHEKKPKIIYVARNPKDTCVSFYHYCRTFHGMNGSFDDFAELMLHDNGPLCPFWDHILPFWKTRDRDNMLFLTYEEMKRDQVAAIKKAAKFLDKSVTDEQVIELREHLKFSKMSTNPSVNVQLLLEEAEKNCGEKNCGKTQKDDPNSKFIRKGKVGDWTNYMSEDLAQRFDKWTEEHLRGTGLKFDTDITPDEE